MFYCDYRGKRQDIAEKELCRLAMRPFVGRARARARTHTHTHTRNILEEIYT